MRIGISVITHDGQNIWENGMGQNVLFLAESLQRIDFVEEVLLLEVGNQGTMPPQVDLAALGLTLERPQDVTQRIDVAIELAGALPVEWLQYFRACGGKVAYLCVGHPYAGLVEPNVFSAAGAHHDTARCDEVWVLPMFAPYAPMLRTLHRCPVHRLPYLWSPRFVAARVAELQATGYRFGFAANKSGSASWRVAMFEPNISVIKTSMVPMLICDEAYRKEPDAISAMHALNTLHMTQHPTLLYLANSLDLVREHKAIFHGRHDFAGFMVQHADAVVAHQWSNAQNYSYLDALYGDYPLVHNSPWLEDAGYYYPEFDIQAGAAALLCAKREHAGGLPDYRARSRRVIDSVSPLAPANVDAYAEALLRLVGGDPGLKVGMKAAAAT